LGDWQFFITYFQSSILGYFFLWLKLCNNFDTNSARLHFGRLFHKLVWSPWRRSKYFCFITH
jgi:hypothetical protein